MWDQIERNKRRSVFVVTAMGVLLVGIGVALGIFFTNQREGALVGGAVAFGVWCLLWLTMRSQGDSIMLQMTGAREIQKKDHPRLFNTVEEMTIAAGLPGMPRVFIVDDPAPNAFAVGRDPNQAAVAVTIGLLELLNRDELQGVVAHEIGHIKNRDVALMTTAGIMMGAIVLLAEIGMRALWFGGGSRRSRDDSGGGGQAIVMIVAIVFMILAPILAQLMYFALSRRREYLADASGAMFTRWPEGLASALEKLGQSSAAQADQSRVTAPMYIVRPLREGARRSLSSIFSTHPALESRVRVLRGMGGRADFLAYDQAYSKSTGRHVVGSASRKAVERLATERPDSGPDASVPHERLRDASNAFLAGAGYQRRTCPGCHATLKVPPALRNDLAQCPRCGSAL